MPLIWNNLLLPALGKFIFHIGPQHGIHAGLKALAGGFEEVEDIGVHPETYRNLAFRKIELCLRPVEPKRRGIRIISHRAGNILICQGVELGPLGSSGRQTRQILNGYAYYTIGVRTE